MKNSRTLIEQRRNRICDQLEEYGSVKVQDLAEMLNASPLTIRRDLDSLEEQGLILRHYGGASLRADKAKGDKTVSSVILSRHAIARQAAYYVTNGDIIFINSSSTALLVLKYIQAERVTVITNNAKALMCDTRSDMTVVLTGGELRNPKGVMTGEFTLSNLVRVTATKSFLGCSGLTPEEGFTTASMQEVPINQLMLKRVTGERFILADGIKIGSRHNFISGSPDQISCIITDTSADDEVLAAFQEKGIRVVKADPLKRLE